MSETQLIPGAAGSLELMLDEAKATDDAPVAIAVCCHPHPLHGGTMLNKVVHILAKSMTDLGCQAVRFNFRGVGRSEGKFADGVGERDDLIAVVNWCRHKWPEVPIWLAGFSFGAYVAAMAHEQIQPQRLLLVAPAVDMYPEMQSLRIKTQDWMLIQGEQDEIISPNAVKDWLDKQTIPGEKRFFADAGHFFHGRLNQLKEAILATWTDA